MFAYYITSYLNFQLNLTIKMHFNVKCDYCNHIFKEINEHNFNKHKLKCQKDNLIKNSTPVIRNFFQKTSNKIIIY